MREGTKTRLFLFFTTPLFVALATVVVVADYCTAGTCTTGTCTTRIVGAIYGSLFFRSKNL